MAEATINDTQHAMTYLLLTFLPFIFTWFGSLLKTTATQLCNCREWHQQSNQLRFPLRHFPVKHRKKKFSTRSLLLGKKGTVRSVPATRSLVALQYLLPSALLAYKVGCQIERFLKIFRIRLHRPHMLQRIAYQSERGFSNLQTMRFDTDSFLIGVDSFASVTMATRPDQFEDLILDAGQSVQGIEGGLAIKGHGTFIFDIEDDEGTVHKIKIADSMYVPDLKFCLLSPQHWAQKAHENARGTRMETDAQGVILIWGHGNHRRTIPHSRDTNTPVFRTAPTTSTYRAFSAHVEAMEANFHRREHVIQFPGRRRSMHDEEEFLAEENLLLSDEYKKTDTSVTEGASHDDETIKAGNVQTDTSDEDEQETETARVGPLTFDPTPQLEDDEQHQHDATDDQAELMQWHHRLGHLSFAKLKKLAILGEIPKRLAKVKPPVCAGCLFGAMTKIPWRGKEGASDHTVFEVTAPGQIVSVNQMISTQVGFIAQLKGALTKKRYTAATVFTDHYSRLQCIHLMTRLTSQETINTKRAFEILHYHCDNGQFSDNKFKTACSSANQRLTFCGVNAHFQNGIA